MSKYRVSYSLDLRDDHLTHVPGVPARGDIVRGMAHFPGSGPAGKTCGDCQHRGYQRETKTEKWDPLLQRWVSKWYHHGGCAMFKRLTGKHGPPIKSDNKACKYFVLGES